MAINEPTEAQRIAIAQQRVQELGAQISPKTIGEAHSGVTGNLVIKNLRGEAEKSPLHDPGNVEGMTPGQKLNYINALNRPTTGK